MKHERETEIWHSGFESGLKYALSFVETATKHRLSNTDIMILANMLEVERPWRNSERFRVSAHC